MDQVRPEQAASTAEAAAFVRFCYRRRRAGWPELYDEMCAVAGRRLYNGWGFAELADHGIGFSLYETPALAALAREVTREEAERRIRAVALAASSGSLETTVDLASAGSLADPNRVPVDVEVGKARRPTTSIDDVDHDKPTAAPALRLAGAVAG